MKFRFLFALVAILAFTMATGVALAAPAGPTAVDGPSGRLLQPADASGPALYIVQLQAPPLASYFGGIENLEATSPSVTGEQKLDMDSDASRAYMDYLDGVQAAMLDTISQALGRQVSVDSQWNVAFNGFAIELSPEEAAAVAELEGVQMVQREFMRYPQTDVGPQWIGADDIWSGAATGSAFKGEGVLVGIIDTGLNLGHPSFADVGGDGYNHTNPLGSGNYLGLCASNPGSYPCNDKTIGFYIFTGEVTQDGDGHGSHTGSTTAGNYLNPGTVDLSPYNQYSPAISGVAPHANIIGYKACQDAGGCPLAALINSINQATANGVDVINYSIGGGSSNPWTDSDALAFLAAQNAGVVPVSSAGNSGPGASTVGSPGDAPWMLTVGASTHNRAGNNAAINLTGGNTTPPPNLSGKGFSLGVGPAPIVYAASAPYSDALCQTPAAPGTFTGKIVVCDRGTNARVAKGYNVLQGGAVGMVLSNLSAGESMNGDVHWLPAVQIKSTDGTLLKTWLASGSNHMATIAGTTLNFDPSNGDVMAGFSSRGPLVNVASDIIKPDVTAPGVDILAAYRDLPPGPEDPTRNYGVVSGTSMSSPHTAGAAALLSGLNPGWTPAEIKAALMSTGKVAGVVKEDGVTQATPFDMGGGRVQVDLAAQSGLLFDVAAGAFQAANPGSGGIPKNLNLASLGNDDCGGICTWQRTVEAVDDGTWNVSTSAPAGMTLTVSPNTFTLNAGQTQVLNITANVTGLPVGTWAFGQVTLTPNGGAFSVQHLPVAVKPSQNLPAINVTPGSLSSTQPPDSSVVQQLNVGNTGAASLDWTIFEDNAAAPELVDWSDNFDSYTTGSQLHGQGGWKGWANDPAAGALASNAQARSAPNSADILGASDLVHEYSGYTSGQWTYTAWQYVPSSMSGQSYFIMLNGYDDAGSTNNWSTQVMFDGSTNLVTNEGVTGGQLPLVENQWVEIRVEIDLDANTQDFYYGNQLLYAGTWTEEVSGGGAANIGAVDLFANNATSVYYDDMSLVGATTAVCSAPDDIPWASVNPTAGSTTPAGSTPVNVTFDSTGLAVGTYTGTLCVESNDPVTPLVQVPLELNVEEGGVCTPGQTVYFSDFEANDGGWTETGYGEWEWGAPVPGVYEGCDTTPRPEPAGAYSGVNVWGTNLDGCYANSGQESVLVSQTFDFSAVQAPIDLDWQQWYEIFTTFDKGEVYVNGTKLWEVVSSTATPSWLAQNIDLSAYAGNPSVTITFRLYATTVVNRMGWYVDDIHITGCTGGAGGDPNIDVSPLSMQSTQQTNTTTQQTLTVANTGGGTLNWDIDEDNTTLPPIDAPATLTPQPAAEVVGAPAGAAPEAAQGQSALWRGPAALLYDNGPQVTHPGGGAGGADASAVQTGLGNSTYGFGHAVSSGFRVADDFTVPAGGWNVNSITFFAYQTGSTTASTINALNVRIWDGPPNAGGSVIWGDTTTNRLASSAWSNIYRVLDTALTNTQRPIMADVATIGTFLPAGTYWVDWQTGGTLASGPWAHPVTILGQVAKPGSNGLQYNPTTATWDPAIDTGVSAQQDFPFIIEGTAGGGSAPCTALLDMAWLTLSPANGSNGGGTDTDVTVTFDSTGLPNGTYTGNLCVTSNDPDAGPGNGTDLVIVPVTLTVQPPTAVALTDLAAGVDQMPAPLASLPLAALPAAAAGALGAAFVWRRRRS